MEQHQNFFKIGLYQKYSMISEIVFSADDYNPVIRYSVDVRSMLPSILEHIQKILTIKNPTLK